MTTKRRTYTDEFKREAVRLWETTDKTAAAIEANLAIARQERDILKKAVAITSASLSTGFSNPKS